MNKLLQLMIDSGDISHKMLPSLMKFQSRGEVPVGIKPIARSYGDMIGMRKPVMQMTAEESKKRQLQLMAQQAQANQATLRPMSASINREATMKRNRQYAASTGKRFNPNTGAVSPMLSDNTDRTMRRIQENIVNPMFEIEMGLVGAGFVGRGAKSLGKYAVENTALKNASNLNPWAYQYNLPKNTMWRGLGKEGMEDAIESGLFRAKQNVVPEYYPGRKFQMNKSFGENTYFTPKFNTAATYGDTFIAEVPKSSANWKQRYKRSDWSQISDRPIPITEGRILQKDWLRGYKEVPTPAANNRFSVQTIAPGRTIQTIKEGAYNPEFYYIDEFGIRRPKGIDAAGMRNSNTTLSNEDMPKLYSEMNKGEWKAQYRDQRTLRNNNDIDYLQRNYFKAFGGTNEEEIGLPKPSYWKNKIYKGPTEFDECKGEGCSKQATKGVASLYNLDYSSLNPQDAWYKRAAVIKGGGKEIYNTSNKTDVQSVYGDLRVGDFVSLDRPGDPHVKDVSKVEGYTLGDNEQTEHLGYVVGFDTNGVPLIKHGHEGNPLHSAKSYVQPITDLSLPDIGFNYNVKSIYRAKPLLESDDKELKSFYYKNLLPSIPLSFYNKENTTTDKEKFINAYNKNSDKFQKETGLSPEEIAAIGNISYGIFGNESKFNNSKKRPIKQLAAEALYALGLKKTSPSLGPTQLKYDELNVGRNETRKGKLLRALGVQKEDINNVFIPTDYDAVTKATFAPLAENYRNLKSNPKFGYNPDDNTVLGNVPIGLALAKSWQNPSLRNVKKSLQEGDSDYANNVYRNMAELEGNMFPVNLPEIVIRGQKKKQGGIIKDNNGYWNPSNWGKAVEIGNNKITMQGVYQPLLGVSDTGDTQMMYPNNDYKFDGESVTEYPMMQNGGGLLSLSVTCSNCGHSWKSVKGGSDPLTCHNCGGIVKMQEGGLWNKNKAQWADSVNHANMDKNFVQRYYLKNGPSMQIPGKEGTSTHYMEESDGMVYPTVVQYPGDALVKYLNGSDRNGAYNYAKKTGQYIKFPTAEQASWYAGNGYKTGKGVLNAFANGGYTVSRSSDRKGKTHKVTGPDGTVKYFGDSKLGQHPKDPQRKAAFYARHKSNLAGNPYFRAFARKTWEEGGSIELINNDVNPDDNNQYTQAMETNYEKGGEMIRRANGSYSPRGLWDNVRANKGSGKKPTKEMLQQERKIKAKEMKNGGTNNEGFRALPEYVQANILSNMGYGGYYNPMMADGGTYQDIIDRLQKREERLVAKGYKAVDEGREKKADRILGRAARVEDRKIRLMEGMDFGGYYDPMSLMQQGGEPNGEMALGQMAAVSDKMSKLLKFVRPEQNLDPWIASKLAVMDDSADAIADYMMYGPDAQEMEEQMRNGGYIDYRGKRQMSSTPTWSGNMGYEDGGETLWHANWNDTEPSYESVDPMMEQFNQDVASMPARSIAINIPVNAPAAKLTAVPPSKRSSYSVIDFMNSQGMPSDYATRKALAEQMGLQGYRGTADQNMMLLSNLKQAAQSTVSANTSGISSSQAYNMNDGNMLRKGYNQSFDGRFPQFGEFSRAQFPVAADQILPSQKPNAPLQGVVDTQKSGVNPLIPLGGVAAVLATAGMTAADLMNTDLDKLASGKSFSPAMKTKLTKAKNALTKAAMQETGKAAQEAVKEFMKSPKKLQKMLDNLDAMEISGDIYQTRSGTGMRNLQTWKMGQEAAAEQMIMRDLENQKMLSESAAETKALRSSAAQRAAATRAANKGSVSGKTAAVAAQEARPWYNALKEGYAAARATPLLKFLRKQDGGESDSMAENILEFVDPTGISSYDDAYRAWNNQNMPLWEKALITSTALPLVGKFGKAAKAATSLSKMRKGLNAAGKVMTPVAQMDKYVNPASQFVGALTARGLQNAPRPVRAAAQFGSLSNQSGRFWNGADMMMGYKQSGGPVIGDEMEVTPEQLEQLRAQGYQFEII